MIDSNIAKQSLFIKEWVDANMDYFKKIYPNLDDTKLRSLLERTAQERATNHRAALVNDYQDDRIVQTDLLTTYDWYKTNKPICAGHGTFFFNHNKVTSPIQGVIDGRISDRKMWQRKRDEYISDRDSYEYQYGDMMQKESKIKINSIYGSFGASTFQLYNIYTASSTTGTAQSLISATEIGFEAFLSNNVMYKTMDECIMMLDYTLKDAYELPFQNVVLITDMEMVFGYLKSHFVDWKPQYEPMLRNYLRHCDNIELTKIYYKNNIYALMDCPFIHDILVRVFDKTESFRDPNSVPENIVEDLTMLWDYCNEFVFYNHAYTERINRLKNDKRKSVVLIDTDSNMINIQPWIDYLKQDVWVQSSTNMNEDNMIFTSVNIIAFLVTKMVRGLLNKYCRDANVLEEMTPRINMKNEFYFPKMLLAKVKKRYVASIKLQEGKEYEVPKVELKGHDFRKAVVNEDIREHLENIIWDCILNIESVDIPGILSRLDGLEKEIRDSLACGDRKYLTRMNCKIQSAYKDPLTQGAVLSVELWNIIYPHKAVSPPDKLDVVLLDIPNEKKLEVIRTTFPREYTILKDVIFHGQGTVAKIFQEKGIKYIALPNDGEPIPEWVRPFINTNKIISRNIGTFTPILEALGLPGTSGGEAEYFSNIIDI